MSFNTFGIAVAAAGFVIIGIFHPIVIKAEYYLTSRVWPAFAVAGVLLLAASAAVGDDLVSAVLGFTGCTCLWSIHELKEQTRRVERGWFPKNPKRGDPDR